MAQTNGKVYRRVGLYSPHKPNRKTYQREYLNYLKKIDRKSGGNLKKSIMGNMEVNMGTRDRYNRYLKSRAQETKAWEGNSNINRLQHRINSKANATSKKARLTRTFKGMSLAKRRAYLRLLKKRTNPKSYTRSFNRK